MKEMRIIRRGIPREEYLEYFRNLASKEVEEGLFVGSDWEVLVDKPRDIKMFGQAMKEVDIVFRAEETLVDQMVAAFRLQFMRA